MSLHVLDARRIAGDLYGRAAAGRGRVVADRLLASGSLPVQLGPALRWLFRGDAPAHVLDAATTIEERRAAVARAGDRYRFEHAADDPAVRWPVLDPGGDRTGAWFATAASVPSRWGVFLTLCADAVGARTIVELGTCVGVSGAYLGASASRPTLVTFDASADLALHARSVLTGVADSFEVVVGTFDATVEARVAGLEIDVAFIDGHHDGEATERYLDLLTSWLVPGALVVLDDVHLYGEMRSAWDRIARRPGFDAAVDVGRFGVLRWTGDLTRSASAPVDLSRWTGRWRARSERRPLVPQR